MPDTVTNCIYMFYNARALDQNIYLSQNLVNAFSMFSYATSLNQNIQLPNSLKNCYGMFYDTWLLDQNIQIPNGVQSTGVMFFNASNMTYGIHIPESVNFMSNMFYSAENMTDVYIHNANATPYSINCIIGMQHSRKITVHCPNLSVINNTSSGRSVVGNQITYDANWYNATYNVQLTTSME